MCVVHNCNQSSYYESKEGECYYHWKVRIGLIEKPIEHTITDSTRRNEYFVEYQKIVMSVLGKIKTVEGSDKEDLKQHLLMTLWLLTDIIKADAHVGEIHNFIKLSLTREANRYIKTIQTNVELTVETIEETPELIVNIDEVIEEKENETHQRHVVHQFVFNELDDLERMLFNDLFLTEEVIVLRDLGPKYNKSYVWVHKYGQRLYNRFKQYISVFGYKAEELLL